MTLENHQQRLGQRLREIRSQQDMTLQEVEERSGGRWKAAVIGAYERGDRAISAPKLIELARFYRVPVSQLLAEQSGWQSAGSHDPERVSVDLAALADSDGPRARSIDNYARDLQARRGDFNGRVLTLRADDLRTLSATFSTTPTELRDELEAEGLLFTQDDEDDIAHTDPADAHDGRLGDRELSDADRLEVLIQVDGEPSPRRARVEPDGTLRLMSAD